MRKWTVRTSDDLGREIDELAESQEIAKADLLREGLAVVLGRWRYEREIADLRERLATAQGELSDLNDRVRKLEDAQRRSGR